MSKQFNIAKSIKELRANAGLTQEALARKADISYNTIIKLESGAIKDPRISTLTRVARALQVSIDELIAAE